MQQIVSEGSIDCSLKKVCCQNKDERGERVSLPNSTLVPGRQFWCKCGVRQGDPLSPLIFVLAADLLQTAINEALADNLLQLPIPSAEPSTYPVIQYADDTIILLPACLPQAIRLKKILTDYADSVGLHINFSKSTLIPINTPAEGIGNCNRLSARAALIAV